LANLRQVTRKVPFILNQSTGGFIMAVAVADHLENLGLVRRSRPEFAIKRYLLFKTINDNSAEHISK